MEHLGDLFMGIHVSGLLLLLSVYNSSLEE